MNGDKIQLDYSFWWFYIVKEKSQILINNIAFFKFIRMQLFMTRQTNSMNYYILIK